jgi:hypothetical protein
VRHSTSLSSRARPPGAPGGQPRQGSEHRRGSPARERGTSGRPAAGAGAEGGTRRWQATAWPAAFSAAAHRRGPLPRAVSPAPARRRSPPSRTPVTAPARANRAVLPRRASCRRAKITVKGAPKGASPTAMAQAPPLTLIFHGKIGAYREDS